MKPYWWSSKPNAAASPTLTTNQPSPSGFLPVSVSTSSASGTGVRSMGLLSVWVSGCGSAPQLVRAGQQLVEVAARDQRRRGGEQEVEGAVGHHRGQRRGERLAHPVERVGHQHLSYPGAAERERAPGGRVAGGVREDHLAG